MEAAAADATLLDDGPIDAPPAEEHAVCIFACLMREIQDVKMIKCYAYRSRSAAIDVVDGVEIGIGVDAEIQSPAAIAIADKTANAFCPPTPFLFLASF